MYLCGGTINRMKASSFTRIFPALILLSGLLCTGENTYAISSSPVHFENDEWNFGSIGECDGSVAHTFRYTNCTSAPLVIETIRISCGCITPRYSKAPVLPGQMDSIRVVFDPAGRPGNFSRTVSIKFSCSDTPLSLTIRGNVTAGKRSADGEYPVSAGDGLRMTHKALNFGQMGQNVSRSYTVGFFNGSSQEIRLSFRIDPHTSWLRVKGGGIVKPGGRCTAEVSCFITGDTLYGCCDCRLIPCIGNRPIGAGISVAVVATDNFEQVDPERVPRLAVDASYFEFGRIRTMEHTFTLSNTGTEPLIVRRVECSRGISADTETPFTILPGGQQGLRCRITASEGGRFTGVVTLITNDPSNPVCRLRLLSGGDRN